MTHYQPQWQPIHPQQPQQPQWQPPRPPSKTPNWWRRNKHFVLYPVTFFAGGVLAAIPSGDTTSANEAAASAQPTVTVTQTAPAEPGATTTVPGPKTTVTVTAKPAAPPAPPAAATVMNEDGVYLVGTDVKPGTYRSSGGGTCYWARLRNLDGDIDSIIANNIGSNPVVTIRKADKAFETSRCGEWKRIS